jgi:hypothetical protein
MADDRRFTDLELERSLANDLPEARARELADQATAADRTRLDELRAEHQAFLASVDVGAEVRAIAKRAARTEPERPKLATWWRWVISGGALAAAAAAIVLVVTRRPSEPQHVDDDLQVKGGGVTLIIQAARGTTSQQLHDRDLIEFGARIRFEVGAAKPGYLVVVGFDARGESTVYYPYGATAPVAFDPRTEHALPGAIELDATVGDERFSAIYGERPFALDAVIPAVRGRTALPPGVTIAEVTLHKVPK